MNYVYRTYTVTAINTFKLDGSTIKLKLSLDDYDILNQ